MEALSITPHELKQLVPSQLNGTEGKFFHYYLSLWKIYFESIRLDKEKTLTYLDSNQLFEPLRQFSIVPDAFLHSQGLFVGISSLYYPNISSMFAHLEDAEECLSFSERMLLSKKVLANLNGFHNLNLSYPDFHLENVMIRKSTKEECQDFDYQLLILLFLLLPPGQTFQQESSDPFVRFVDIEGVMPACFLGKEEYQKEIKLENWLAFYQLFGFLYQIDLETEVYLQGKAAVVDAICSMDYSKSAQKEIKALASYQLSGSCDLGSILLSNQPSSDPEQQQKLRRMLKR